MFRIVTTCAACLLSISALAGTELKKGDRILFLGDSITWGATRPTGFITLIKHSIEAKHRDLGIETINAGIRGNKAFDLAKRLQTDVLDKKPTIVFVFIGVNDVWHGRDNEPSARTFQASLKDITERMKAAGIRVILCTHAVFGEKPDGTNGADKMMDKYADFTRQAAADAKVELIDLRKAFLEYLKVHNKENKDKGILTHDTIHLSEEGNRLVAREMLGALNLEPTDAPVASPPPRRGKAK